MPQPCAAPRHTAARSLTVGGVSLALAVSGLVAGAHPAHAAEVDRIGGIDRVDTAIKIYESNRALYPTGGVILARSDSYADSLAATPLAAAGKTPILVTAPGQLDPRVLAAIKRQKVTRVGIVGGEQAISAGVAKTLSDTGIQVYRLAGVDRYETARQIAVGALAARRTPSTRVFVATGTNFPDALAAGAAAAKAGGVVLLSQGPRLDAATKTFLTSSQTSGVVAVGGPAATAVRGAGVTAQAVNGTDRYDTAVRLANAYVPGATNAVVASGEAFADALAGGVLAGLRGAPLVLTPATWMSPKTAEYLQARKPRVTVLGGERAVSAAVLSAIAKAVGGAATPPSTTDASALYTSSRGSALAAQSVRVAGTLTAQGQTATIDVAGDLGGTSQHAVVTTSKGNAEILDVKGATYIKADASLWATQVPAIIARTLHGQWVRVSDAQVAQAAGMVGLSASDLTVRGLLARLLPASGPLGSTLRGATVTDVAAGGVPAKRVSAMDGASMTVAADAAGLPLQVTGPTTGAGSVTLSQWNSVPSFSAPTGFITAPGA